MKSKVVIVLFLVMLSNSVFSQKLTQTLKGRVLDKETQMPLIGASVIVVNSSPFRGTSCDEKGYFKITDVPVGRHTIEVTFMGYEKISIPQVLLNTGKELVLNIEMKESLKSLEGVKIVAGNKKGEAQNSMALVSSRSFNVEETRRYAGGVDDPGRLASVFAGVSSNGSVESNAIMIRGNAPTGVLWQVEGLEVPVPSHFANTDVMGGGAVTLFSNQILSNSDFFTGAFPAEYGNAFSGVFDVHLRTGNNEKRESAIQIGVLGIDFSSEGAFRKGGKASYLFNYRYSTFGLVTQFLPKSGLPVYQDLCFKLNFPTQNAGTFSLWGMGGIDKYTNKATEDSTQWTNDHARLNLNYDYYPATAGLNHKINIGNSSYLTTLLGISSYARKGTADFLDDTYTYIPYMTTDYQEFKYTFKTSLNHKFSPQHSNRTGIICDYYTYNYNNWLAYNENGKVSALKQLSNGKGNSSLLQAFTESKYDFVGGLSFNAGLHAMYFAQNEKYSIEPRLSARWNFIADHAISLAYGIHSQMQTLSVYQIQKDGTTPNKNLDFSKAQHFVLGYDWSICENVRLKVEGYYQLLSQIPVENGTTFSLINIEDVHTFDKILVSQGKGRNYGVDFTLERFLNNGLYGMMTASLFESKYKGSDNIERNTLYATKYVVNMLGGKEWKMGKDKDNLLGINGRLYLKGGDRKSPVDVVASQVKKEVVYDESLAYTKQNPAYYRFDVSIYFRRNHPNYSTIWTVQLNNALFSPTTYEDVYDYTQKKVVETKGGSPFPSISWKIEF